MKQLTILILCFLNAVAVQAFQWNNYNSQLTLMREISNSQMMIKAESYDQARVKLDSLIVGIKNGSVAVGNKYQEEFIIGAAQLGILKLNRLTIWNHIAKKGSKAWLNSDEFKTQNAIVTEHYIDGLNHAIKFGEKIDPQWLYIITASTILDTQVREAVTRYEMHQNQNNPPTETYFWDSYSSIYEAYLNEKDYDNAQRILSEMTSKFPEKKNKVQKAQKQVEKYIEENAEEIKSEAAKTEIPVKKSVQAALEKVAVLTVDDVFEDPVEVDKAVAVYAPKLIQFKSVLEQYGIFILAFLVFLGMYFFSNRKSKK
jgi:hypothetical protein